MSDNKAPSAIEWSEESGISKDEWELETLIDKIRSVGTLEAIGILRKLAAPSIKEDQQPSGDVDFLKELREKSVKRAIEKFNCYDNQPLTFWTTALAGELGELCNMIKKLQRVEGGGIDIGSTYTAKDITPEMLKEEIGGIAIYLDLLASLLNIGMQDAITFEFNRVSKKYDLGYYLNANTQPIKEDAPAGDDVFPCPECGGITGHSNRRCSLMSLKYAQQEIINVEQKWIKINAATATNTARYRYNLSKIVTHWQGKFEILRRENNALRKQKNKVKEDTPIDETKNKTT